MSDGIWRYIRLILEKASAKKFEDETQEAIDKGTDPKKAEENLGKVEKKLGGLGTVAKRVGGILAGFFAAGKIIQETVNAEREFAQLEATVRSTGGAAGYTAQQLSEMATELSRASTFGGGDITNAQVRLLTYTNVQGEAFERATQAAMDMATALRSDVAGAAEVIGRALQDPIAATAALSRQGFKFTEEQKALMEQMMAVGDVAGAQAIIFEELELAYGGSAEAARNTLGGALAALKNEWDAQISLSSQATSGITDFINAITGFLPKLREYIDAFVGGLQIMGAELAVFQYRARVFLLELPGGRLLAERAFGTVEENRRMLQLMRAAADEVIADIVAPPARQPSVPAAGFTASPATREEVTAKIDKQRQAVEQLIDSLTKERDALLFSEEQLLRRSEAFQNATEAEQQMMIALLAETEGLKRYTAELQAAAREKERLDGVTKSLVESLQDELNSLTMTRSELIQMSEAYLNASDAQRMQIDTTLALIDAQRALEASSREMMDKQRREIEATAENMTRAFEPFFLSLRYGFGDTAKLFEGFREGAAGVGAAVVEELTKGKAEYHMAEGIGKLASGTWPPNPAALGAAAQHFAAAAAFRSIPGIISSLGRSSSSPAGRATMARGAEPSRLDRFGPDIQIYVDGVDPKNPRHQALIGETARKYTGRTSGRVEYR